MHSGNAISCVFSHALKAVLLQWPLTPLLSLKKSYSSALSLLKLHNHPLSPSLPLCSFCTTLSVQLRLSPPHAEASVCVAKAPLLHSLLFPSPAFFILCAFVSCAF